VVVQSKSACETWRNDIKKTRGIAGDKWRDESSVVCVVGTDFIVYMYVCVCVCVWVAKKMVDRGIHSMRSRIVIRPGMPLALPRATGWRESHLSERAAQAE
jgi:hypothetical protein